MAITSLGANDTGATSRTVINDNFTDLDTTKADLASPAFTGNPTAPTQTASDNSTKIATTAYVDSATPSTEETVGTTHALTTVAGQTVLVIAKGDCLIGDGVTATITLKYNTVTKDTVVTWANLTERNPFTLVYQETPGAATQNITVETTGGSLANVKITVMKF